MITVIEGEPGAGKSYIAVNKLFVEILLTSNRPIVTNLPVKVDNLIAYATKNEAKAHEFRKRITFLKLGNKIDVRGDKDEVIAEGVDELQQFWYSMPPGAVGVFDELGDVFNAREWKNNPQTLGTYINHHRHYKHDNYFLCQSLQDLDSQLRRKCAFLWTVENGEKSPMFPDSSAFKWIRWPIQVFFVHKSRLQHVADKAKRIPVDKEVILPKRRGFENYESFSRAEGLDGVAHVDSEQLESNDIKSSATKKRELRKTFARLGATFALIAFFAALFMRLVYAMVYNDGDIMAAFLGRSGTKNQTESASVPAESQGPSPDPSARNEGSDREGTSVSGSDGGRQPEFLRLATPAMFRTNLDVYYLGDDFRGYRVEGVYINGILLRKDDEEKRIPWPKLFRLPNTTESS